MATFVLAELYPQDSRYGPHSGDASVVGLRDSVVCIEGRPFRPPGYSQISTLTHSKMGQSQTIPRTVASLGIPKTRNPVSGQDPCPTRGSGLLPGHTERGVLVALPVVGREGPAGIAAQADLGDNDLTALRLLFAHDLDRPLHRREAVVDLGALSPAEGPAPRRGGYGALRRDVLGARRHCRRRCARSHRTGRAREPR